MSRKLLFVFLVFCTFSCIKNEKLIYLQSDNITTKSAVQYNNTRNNYLVQSNDVLAIDIVSPADPAASEIFNRESNNVQGGMQPAATFYMKGYSVDADGNITLPLIGKLKVSGSTIEDITYRVQEVLKNYLKNATVTVKLVSFKVTVLGDVKSPGTYYVFNNQANIFEALGMAGDLIDSADRTRIKLIRQNSKGSEVVLIDLTEENLLRLPYYYLQPNDVVYAERLEEATKRTSIPILTTIFAGLGSIAALGGLIYAITNTNN
ncbi:MAG: polysaccharide transporter [Thalassobius sp.]|nr:polysaccharide transporter [Thalassovita sp.]